MCYVLVHALFKRKFVGTLLPLGADTSKAVGQNYHKLKVSPSYFDVFRMKDKEGRAITPLVENAYRPLVITAEAEDFFFGGSLP